MHDKAWERTVGSHLAMKPLLRWSDGHILGNGDIGAVVWGGPETVHVGLSKHDVHDLRPAEGHGVRWDPIYPRLVERVRQGDRDVLRSVKNRADWVDGFPPAPVSCGRLSVELCRGLEPISYRQELSLVRAACESVVRPAWPGWKAVGAIRARTVVLAEHNLVLMRLSSDEVPQRIGWTYDQNPASRLPAPTYAVRKGVMPCGLMTQAIDARTIFAVAVACIGENVSVFASGHGLRGEVDIGGDKREATLIISLVSKRDAGGHHPEALALKTAKAVQAEMLGDLWSRHHQWWADYWSRSRVEHNDTEIARLWAMGIYAMGAGTRPATSPLHLQGLWNQHDHPAWASDFHFNVNIEESHWAACASNHIEQQAALVRVLVHDWRDELRRFAREQYDAPGLAVPFCCDWLGRAIGGWPLAAECGNTAWAAQHVWWHWLFTGNQTQLREETFPFLRECVEFYLAILHKADDGLYHLALSHSPEQVYPDANGHDEVVLGSDPTLDLALIRYLFSALCQAAERLGVRDDAILDRCRDVLAHVPPLPVQEGVLIDQAAGYFSSGDRAGYFPLSHRHPSRLVPIFPCEEIGLHSAPETLELGLRSFAEFQSYGPSNFTGWSMAFQACIAARLGLGEAATHALQRLRRHFGLGGGLLSHDSVRGDYGLHEQPRRGAVFQIEATCGAAAAVNEMLLQSTGGVLRVFPAVAPGTEASFTTLRAPGGILVSAACNASGVLWVRLQAERSVEVRLFNPWPGRPVYMENHGNGATTRLRGECLVWRARPGDDNKISMAETRN